MKTKSVLFVMAFLAGNIAHAEDLFVGIDRLNEVLGNYTAPAVPGIALKGHPDSTEWPDLFAPDLSNAQFPEGVWTVAEGELTASKDQVIWTKADYENFVLDLEFKNGPEANSGVIIYTSTLQGWPAHSVEIQIADDHAEKWGKANPTFRCGAVFGSLAASESVVKQPGEWNRYTITARGPFIDVVLNGKHVTSMDMRKWDSATHNPDGTKRPRHLSTALSEQPTKGRIGLQGKHGGAPIGFRNVKIKALD